MFQANRKSLQSELSLLAQIAGQKNVIPALSAVRVEVKGNLATLAASNAEVAVIVEIAVDGEDWKGCVPAKPFYDLIRLWDGEAVTLTPQESQVLISMGRSRHRLPVTQFQDFPAIQVPVVDGRCLSANGDALRAGLERVLPHVDYTESAQYNLKGVKFEASNGELKMIATNGHRLGVATVPSEGDLDVLIPTQATNLLLRLDGEQVTVWRSDNQVVFHCGSRTLISRLPTGQFPNWQMLMPKELPLSATIDTKEWINAFRRASVTRDQTFKIGVGMVLLGVVLVFSKDELVIDTKVKALGRSEEAISIQSNLNGNKVYMGVNPDYVMDFLKLAGEKTKIALKDDRTTLKLTDGSNFECLVFPIALKEKPSEQS